MTGYHKLTLMTQLADYDLCRKDSPGAPHAELTEALPRIEGTRALDIGCGSGCNSLWLNAKGFDVTAWDNNASSLARLNNIVTAGNISGVHTAQHDLNRLRFNGAYDLVL